MANYVVGIASVTKTIKIHRPGREEEQFTAEIRIRDTDDQDKLLAKQKANRLKGNDHLREDVLSVGGLDDKEGKPLESSKALIDALFKDPYARGPLTLAWNEVQRGVPEEAAKN
ncbi:hypothetical protein [Salinicola sp. CPA57]|uniref:hypothetical protein n=1 Tax=Salinicola sp. CPA57 TaxID=1949080 RepID=UPI00130020F2|nr:hypothetical protein [Salinicola sp. CPA57]